LHCTSQLEEKLQGKSLVKWYGRVEKRAGSKEETAAIMVWKGETVL
jgi:ribosomal protein S15P/S13E